jgi:FKBP-type peptidyl-prolyl cis-trans isomerase FkpA
MNRFKLFLLLSFLFLGGVANSQYLTGPNGVKYFFWRTNGRPQRANVGDLVFVEMTGKTEKDSVIISSYVQGKSFQIFVPKPTYHGCFFEMLTLMGETDSAEVSVIADSLFLHSLGSEMPPFIRKGSTIKLTIKLVSIVTKAEYDKRMIEEAKFADENQQEDIQKYIAENKLQMTKTATGMYYQFPLKSFSRRVKLGDEVIVNYTGYFLDGSVFDSSIPRNQPFEFKVGTGNVIKGWDEALQLMSVGDKIKIILPYQLAYGESGGSSIPPGTPLVFEIELLNIK